jgi:hypothetical protein
MLASPACKIWYYLVSFVLILYQFTQKYWLVYRHCSDWVRIQSVVFSFCFFFACFPLLTSRGIHSDFTSFYMESYFSVTNIFWIAVLSLAFIMLQIRVRAHFLVFFMACFILFYTNIHLSQYISFSLGILYFFRVNGLLFYIYATFPYRLIYTFYYSHIEWHIFSLQNLCNINASESTIKISHSPTNIQH